MSFIEKVPHIERDVCIPWSERISAALNESYDHEGLYLRSQSRLAILEDESEDSQNNKNQGNHSYDNNDDDDDDDDGISVFSSSLMSSFGAQSPLVSNTEEKKQDEEEQGVKENDKKNQLNNGNNNDTNQGNDEAQFSNVAVLIDWPSFTPVFSSILAEFGEEQVGRVIDSVASEACLLQLLDQLIELCKPTSNRHIRSYLRKHLKRYILRYSDDPREWGTFTDGDLVDIVELEVGEDGRTMSWLFRDVSQNLQGTPHLQQYLVDHYYLPRWQTAIRHLLGTPLVISIDWEHISLASKDLGKAVHTVYHDKSAFVLEELYRAFEAIATYDDDDLVDAIAVCLRRVEIGTVKSIDPDRRNFEIYEDRKTLRLNLCLEAEEFSGVLRWRELVPVIKVAALYRNQFTAPYKMELLAAAAKLYTVSMGDLSMFTNILEWKNLWWTPTEAEEEGFRMCFQQIEGYYREVLRAWHNDRGGGGPGMSPYDDDDGYAEELRDRTEKFVKAWHVIKFNRRNQAQERVLFLTDKAYWTFKFHFEKKVFDESHFKRHDLIDFVLAEIGPYLITDSEEVKALKVYTQEQRSRTFLGGQYKEVEVTPENRRRKMDKTTRKSLNLARYKIFSTAVGPSMFEGLEDLAESQIDVRRVKKKRPDRKRPSTAGMYSSVFMPDGSITDVHRRNHTLQEIAWCLYAVACARQRTPGHEPFIDVKSMGRPKGNLYSKLYNLLQAGLLSKNVDREAQEKEEQFTEEYDPDAHKPQFVFTGSGVLKNPSEIQNNSSGKNRVRFSPQLSIYYHEEDTPPAEKSGREISLATSVGEEDYGITGDYGYIIENADGEVEP